MIRKLYLENDSGDTFHFKYANDVLISEVKGLGFNFDYKYLKFDHIYETIKQDTTMGEISAVLSFIKGYKSYDKFIKFVTSQSKNLKLHYKTIDEKYIYVDIFNLSKKEIEGGYLKSEIVFNKKSYWIKERNLTLTFGRNIGGKTYPYKYPITYLLTEAGKTRLTISGVRRATTIIEIIGDVDNPIFNVYKGNKLTSAMRLFIKESNVNIKVSSVPNNQYIKKIEENSDKDIYSLQDFSKDNFILLEPGELVIEFKSGAATDTLCKLTIFEYHLG